tara:strand:+ start:528 stop:698 length:171 start_codon:yes stop_codon:yes gene_type:complete
MAKKRNLHDFLDHKLIAKAEKAATQHRLPEVAAALANIREALKETMTDVEALKKDV